MVIVQNGECTLYEHRPQSLMLLQVDWLREAGSPAHLAATGLCQHTS